MFSFEPSPVLLGLFGLASVVTLVSLAIVALCGAAGRAQRMHDEMSREGRLPGQPGYDEER